MADYGIVGQQSVGSILVSGPVLSTKYFFNL